MVFNAFNMDPDRQVLGFKLKIVIVYVYIGRRRHSSATSYTDSLTDHSTWADSSEVILII